MTTPDDFAPQANDYTRRMAAALFCAAYQLSIGLLAAWVVIDQVFGGRALMGAITGETPAEAVAGAPGLLASMIVCVAGSIIGGVMNGLFYLQYYAAERGQFEYRFVGSYLMAPIAIGLIGLTAFALVTGGIIVFATAPSETNAVFTDVNLMAYLALGIISGIAWQNIMARVQEAAENIFGKKRRAVSRGQMGKPDEEGSHPTEEREGAGTIAPETTERAGLRTVPRPASTLPGVDENERVPTDTKSDAPSGEGASGRQP